jgi:hypothetical protein
MSYLLAKISKGTPFKSFKDNNQWRVSLTSEILSVSDESIIKMIASFIET